MRHSYFCLWIRVSKTSGSYATGWLLPGRALKITEASTVILIGVYDHPVIAKLALEDLNRQLEAGQAEVQLDPSPVLDAQLAIAVVHLQDSRFRWRAQQVTPVATLELAADSKLLLLRAAKRPAAVAQLLSDTKRVQRAVDHILIRTYMTFPRQRPNWQEPGEA